MPMAITAPTIPIHSHGPRFCRKAGTSSNEGVPGSGSWTGDGPDANGLLVSAAAKGALRSGLLRKGSAAGGAGNGGCMLGKL
jgi:hypothetical protein